MHIVTENVALAVRAWEAGRKGRVFLYRDAFWRVKCVRPVRDDTWRIDMTPIRKSIDDCTPEEWNEVARETK